MVSKTSDAGKTWTADAELPIHNPDSGICITPLKDGTYLLVGNDKKGRSVLNMWRTNKNNPLVWNLVYQLEKMPQKEFSYPCLYQDDEEIIHVCYTWQRKMIKHVTFSLNE